jgi:hypothetical protein
MFSCRRSASNATARGDSFFMVCYAQDGPKNWGKWYVRRHAARNLEGEQRGWLDERRRRKLAEQYRLPGDLDDDEAVAALVRRIDEIPESLVLAQAVKESGWGRSRFAIAGNANFGQRCFTAGCVTVPARRAARCR